MKNILIKIVFLALSLFVADSLLAKESEGNSEKETAKVYLYRTKSPVGIAVIYAVFVDGEQVGIAKNGFTQVLKFGEEKEIEIWGETEKKISMKLKVEPGQEYYVKCAVKMGALTGRPKFKLESLEKGKSAFEKLSN